MLKSVMTGLMLLLSVPALAQMANPTIQRAIQLTYNAKFAEAESLLNGYIASNPQDPRGYIARGTSRDWKQMVENLKGKNDSQVISDYETANKMAFLLWNKDQGNIDKMVNLGNSYLFQARKWIDLKKTTRAGLVLKKCRKHMEEAIAKDPNRWDAYLAIGAFNFYAANIPPGLQILASLIGITGNESLGLKQLGQAASNNHWLQSDTLFLLSYAYGQTKKNYGGALTYLNRLNGMYPNNPHFIFLKGEYAYRAKNFAASRADFAKLFQFCDSKPKGSCGKHYLFLAHYFLAAGYNKEGNDLAGEKDVERAMELNENQFPDRTGYLHYFHGMVLKAEGKKKKAIEAFEKCIAAPGGNPQAKKKAKEELATLGGGKK